MDKPQSIKLFHDLKNDFASMSALTNLHRVYAGKISPEELLNRLHERQIVISLAYEKLYQNRNYPNIRIRDFIDELIVKENKTLSTYSAGIRMTTAVADLQLPLKKALPLAQITVELLSNSYRHAFAGHNGEKKIDLIIENTGTGLELHYSDNGCGLPDSLKSKRTGTLGMQFISSLSRQLGGRAEFKETEKGMSASLAIDIG